MGYFVEVGDKVAIHNLVVTPVQEPVDTAYRILRTSSRPVSVLLRWQVSLKDRRQHKHGRCLSHPIPDRRNPQRPERAGLFLRDQDPAHRLRHVSPVLQIPRQFPKPLLHTIVLDGLKALPVNSGLAAVAAHHRPGLMEKVLSPHLVAQGVKAALGFFLRFRIQNVLEVPNSL